MIVGAVRRVEVQARLSNSITAPSRFGYGADPAKCLRVNPSGSARRAGDAESELVGRGAVSDFLCPAPAPRRY